MSLPRKTSILACVILFCLVQNYCDGQLGLSQQSVGFLPDIEMTFHLKSGVIEQAEGDSVLWDFSDIVAVSTSTVLFTEEVFEDETYLVDQGDYYLINEEAIIYAGLAITLEDWGQAYFHERTLIGYEIGDGNNGSNSFSFWNNQCQTNGYSLMEVKGVGTLMTPAGTFENVTRFRSITTYSRDCLNGSNNWFEYEETHNFYFTPGTHMYLFTTKEYTSTELHCPGPGNHCAEPDTIGVSTSNIYHYLDAESFNDVTIIFGCTDSEACNYNPLALIDEGCIIEGMLCDDGNDETIVDMIQFCECIGGPAAPGDTNEDGMVSIDELLAFLGQFGCAGECSMDFNDDGIVNVFDLMIILENI